MPERVRALDLGDDERLPAQGAGGGAHGPDVSRAFDKRLADRVHARLEGKLQTGPVVRGKRADAQVNARQVEALAGAQFAADGHLAADLGPRRFFHHQLDQPVVEKEPIARLHHLGQRLEAHRNPLPVADHVLAGQREVLARVQLDRLGLDLAEAHLGARQVGHDGHAPAHGPFRGPQARDALAMAGQVAMREVQTRHVQSRADEALQHLG